MEQRQIRALIVDDSSVSRLSIKVMLEKTGLAQFSFTEAEDGADALEKFSPDAFDLIFVDLHMPRMSGPEFLNRIRAEYATCPPAVMITGEMSRDRLLSVVNDNGVSALLLKPVKVDRLRQGLKKVVDALPLTSGPWRVPHGECTAQALEETLEKACGIRLHPLAADAHTSNTGSAVFSMIYLSGSVDWLLQLGFDERAAVTAASRLAGEQLPFENPDLLDAIAEVTNAVAGQLKRLLGERDLGVRLALPMVMAATGIRFHNPARQKVTADKAYYSVTDVNASSAQEGAGEQLPGDPTDRGRIWVAVTVGMQSGLMF